MTLPTRSVPGWLMRPLSVLVEGTWTLLGLQGTPPLTRFAIFMMSATITLSDARAREELGYRPELTTEQGLAALGSELA